MSWTAVVEKVTPYIVKIETPTGYGTGFLCLYNTSRTLCGIATAAHVVKHADDWQQPIRIHYYPRTATELLKEGERVILIDEKTDSAVILLRVGVFEFPEDVIPLLPSSTLLGIGDDVGWLGYPAIESDTLCFFSGSISARQEARKAYLIDGVAIHGVSGGPVVYSHPTDGVQIVGDVSAYRANRVTGETLPGLLIAQDLSHFHAVITHMKSVDEANEKKKEAEAAAAKQAETAAVAASVPPPPSIAQAPVETEAKAAPGD